jgi:hypothetical protein
MKDVEESHLWRQPRALPCHFPMLTGVPTKASKKSRSNCQARQLIFVEAKPTTDCGVCQLDVCPAVDPGSSEEDMGVLDDVPEDN